MAPELTLTAAPPSARPWMGAWAPAWAVALLVAAIALEVRSRPRPADPSHYHERIKLAAREHIPYALGEWVGSDVEPRPSAVKLLRPNVLVERAYRNLRTGETAALLYVQCSDARDLHGHYPPVCYVAHGLEAGPSEPKDWSVGGRTIHATRYSFIGSDATSTTTIVVDYFVALPSGETRRDTDGMARNAKDRRLRQFGAAQVQVVTDQSMSDERRDEVVRRLIEGILPVLDCTTGEMNRD